MGTISRLKLYLISFAILVALIVIPLLGFLITLDDNSTGSKEVQSEDFKTIEKRIKELTAHLKNNPEDGLAFKRLGELYLKACRLSEAVSTYVAAEKILPKESPDKQYKFATSFLKVGDYSTAERAFKEFVITNPDHDLAGNAQYWYAETFRIRQLYTDAATAYLEGLSLIHISEPTRPY